MWTWTELNANLNLPLILKAQRCQSFKVFSPSVAPSAGWKWESQLGKVSAFLMFTLKVCDLFDYNIWFSCVRLCMYILTVDDHSHDFNGLWRCTYTTRLQVVLVHCNTVILMRTKQAFASSILVSGSEIRSCEQISLFHHHHSSRPITTSQQAFDKTLRSPFSSSTPSVAWWERRWRRDQEKLRWHIGGEKNLHLIQE